MGQQQSLTRAIQLSPLRAHLDSSSLKLAGRRQRAMKAPNDEVVFAMTFHSGHKRRPA